ncbi:MAG: rRNA pseudouridine synthase [Muribaculaceae bacterium]|nr:rRNA pseudouridine synthase [Muribaculaceae bacterium]
MDSNSEERKPKRPRIGQQFHTSEGTNDERPRYNNYPAGDASNANDENGENASYRQNRPYGQRMNNGYSRQGGYGNRGAYNNYHRPYQQRPQNNDFNNQAEGEKNAEGAENQAYQQRQYQPRRQYNNYNNYNNGPRQQRSYNNQGGYNRQGGYNNNYNNGQRQQRPYNNQGGYNRQGGYNNNYNNGQRQQRPYNNQGGYNRQGGYNNRQQYNNNGFPGRGKSFTPRPKRIEYEMPIPDPNEQVRLNKYMSNAGICSRREADEFIQQGLVKVNGQVVTELGTKITHNDIVEYDEKVVTLQSKCYILLNKPKDCVTTSDDPNGRLTVMDLVKGACPERIYPVGRLDRNTTGVLLLTNDGDLASKLTHPKYVKKKIYHVWCDRDISEDDMQRIADGIELEDGPIHADAISYATETDRNQAGIEIHSGRNRIVRRIFESLGYHVTKLDRVYFAGLTKKNLPRGRWRYLTQEEVNYLKMGSFE